MALVEEDAVDDALDSLVDGGVVEHDVRRLAAELEGQPLVRARDGPLDRLADLRRAGEGDLVDTRVLDEHSSGVAGPGDDVDDARRQIGLLADIGERQRSERRSLRRLQNNGVACGERGRDFPGEHEEREVPWDDLRRNPDAARIRPEPGMLELVGPAGVVEEVRGDERQVDVA